MRPANFILGLFYFFIPCTNYSTDSEVRISEVTQTEKISLLAIRQHTSQGFAFYDYEGHLRFTLPDVDEPCLGKEPLKENFYKVDFSYGVIPVKTKDGFYLIDGNGKLVAKVDGKFSHVSTIQNGFLIVRRRSGDNGSLLEYYDVNGVRSFGNTRYLDGGKVINETAVVRLFQPGVKNFEQQVEWVLIDKSGKVLKNLSRSTEKPIGILFEEYPDAWSFQTTFWNRMHVFPNGEIHEKYPRSKHEPGKLARLYQIADSNALANNYPHQNVLRGCEMTLVGEEIVFLCGIYRAGVTEMVLLDQYQNEIVLEKDGSTIAPRRLYGEYVMTEERKENKLVAIVLFDLNTAKLSTILPNDPDRVIDNLFIYENNSSWQTYVEKIVNAQGKTIFQLDKIDHHFWSITEAMKYRDSVKILCLTSPKELNLVFLGELPNLEVFELRKYTAEQLPAGLFTHWDNIEYINISYSENLKSLPESMKGLKKLRELDIVDWRISENIETWLQYWPSLRRLRTSLFADIPDEIKEQYPNVIFEN